MSCFDHAGSRGGGRKPGIKRCRVSRAWWKDDTGGGGRETTVGDGEKRVGGWSKRESERERDADGLAKGGEIESARKRVSGGWRRKVDGERQMQQDVDIQSHQRRGPIVASTQIESTN